MEELRRVLVLGAGPAQLGLLRAALRRGVVVIAVDADAAAPGFLLAHRRALLAPDDEPAVERLARAVGADELASAGDERLVALARRVSQRLGLPLAA